MPKILVVVDGKDQATAAIAHLVDSGERTSEDSVLILNVQPPRQPWQQANTPRMLLDSELSRQSRYIRNAMGPWLAEAGIAFETRNCLGDVAKIVNRLAEEEFCDEILIAEPEAGRWAKFVERVTGVRPASYVDRIIPEAPVPVIVVKDGAVERYQGRGRRGCRPSNREDARASSLTA